MPVHHLRKAWETFEQQGLIKTSQKILDFGIRQIIPGQIYWHLAKQYYTTVQKFDIGEYENPPNPYNIYWVDPFAIEYCSTIGYDNRWDNFGKVTSVELTDGKVTDELELWRETFRLRFTENTPWEKTPAVQNAFKSIEKGVDVRRSTKENYLELCNRWDRLFEVLSAEGYKSQKNLIYESNEPVKKGLTSQRSFKAAICDEITIDIGPQGKLLFVDGRHRLVLARLLSLDSVSVVVLRRHKKWMDKREKIQSDGVDQIHHSYFSEQNDDLRNHPDLQDILN